MKKMIRHKGFHPFHGKDEGQHTLYSDLLLLYDDLMAMAMATT